jgi:FMN reductase
VLAVTGGGSGDMSISAVKTSFSWCHGFTLPYHAAARSVDFDLSGALINGAVADRVRRVAYDVVRYAPVLRATFEDARALGRHVQAGVAGTHVY